MSTVILPFVPSILPSVPLRWTAAALSTILNAGNTEGGTSVKLELQIDPALPEVTVTVRERLYELERQLTGHPFARVSHSEIVNLKRVTALDLRLTDTIRMSLTGGVTVYVSRRYVKRIKEVLGL